MNKKIKLYFKLLGLCIILLSPRTHASLIEEEHNQVQSFSLPQELLISIFEFLPHLDQVKLVCKEWYSIAMDPACILPSKNEALQLKFLRSSPYKFAWLARNDPKGKSKIFPWICRFEAAIDSENSTIEINWENAKKVGIIQNILLGVKSPSIYELLDPMGEPTTLLSLKNPKE